MSYLSLAVFNILIYYLQRKTLACNHFLRMQLNSSKFGALVVQKTIYPFLCMQMGAHDLQLSLKGSMKNANIFRQYRRENWQESLGTKQPNHDNEMCYLCNEISMRRFSIIVISLCRIMTNFVTYTLFKNIFLDASKPGNTLYIRNKLSYSLRA